MQGLESRVCLNGQAGKTGPDLRRVAYGVDKSHSPTLHSAWSGEPKVKTQPVQCRHCRLLRLYVAEHTGK